MSWESTGSSSTSKMAKTRSPRVSAKSRCAGMAARLWRRGEDERSCAVQRARPLDALEG